MSIRTALGVALVAAGLAASSQNLAGQSSGLSRVFDINKKLLASGLKIAVTEVDFFTIGQARPSFRIHRQPFRWVANDDRRLADGDTITYSRGPERRQDRERADQR